MKQFFKIYFSTIFLYLCIFIVGAVTFTVINRNNIVFPTVGQVLDAFHGDDSDSSMSTLDKAIKDSKIINILVVGKENVRTDTIMVVSYDPEAKQAKILSIPRDTYYERAGYDNRQQKKINAVYQSEGITGLKSAIENITTLSIQKYVSINYEAVVKIVDLLGGIEVDVPMNMNYSDPMDTPPLEINISKGLQVLDGENALKFLRFRQNSDGTGYPNGDIGRINTQQAFIKTAMKKALGLKLPAVINQAFKYIDTDFTLTEILTIVSGLGGFTSDDIEATIIDNYTKTMDGLSYVIPNPDGIKSYKYKLYGVPEDDEQNLQNNDNPIEIN